MGPFFKFNWNTRGEHKPYINFDVFFYTTDWSDEEEDLSCHLEKRLSAAAHWMKMSVYYRMILIL